MTERFFDMIRPEMENRIKDGVRPYEKDIHVHEISTETEALLDSFALDAEGRINDARRAKSELADFTHRQRVITNTLGAKRNRAVSAADSAEKAEPTATDGDA
jgi:ElaB/YqjD/DUF883 family membrane-anchored ribosome-binding protein